MREHLTALSAERGPYHLVCARTGERPFPVDGLRFADRATAVEAADVATSYRAALRRYDPRVAHHDLIVVEGDEARATRDDAPELLAEFCHEVVGALFEALTEEGHDDVGTAVMDTYLDAAERTDRDELGLALLRSMADELADLPPGEAAGVVRAAAGRLAPHDDAQSDRHDDPVAATLARLETLSLVAGSTVVSEPPGGWVIELRDYELAGGGAFLTLPIAVDLMRRRPDADLAIVGASRTGDGWRFELAEAADPEGLVAVPL